MPAAAIPVPELVAPGANRPHVGHNFAVHTVDAGLFGTALGFASFVTVLPLFLATLTDSALLIGLIAVLHPLGWHLPQLLTARRVAGLTRLLPTVLVATLAERVPFFLLAAVAWGSPSLPPAVTLTVTYLLVMSIGLGGGFTATAFQALVAKIMPRRLRGTFYGTKTAAANLGLAFAAVAAGGLLTAFPGTTGFAVCFFIAGCATIASWAFLALTREGTVATPVITYTRGAFRHTLVLILREDANFRWYLGIRMLCQVATMGTAYYTLFATREHGISVATAGVMTALFAGAQTIGNPIFGLAGDRFGHRYAMAAGMICATAASMLAMSATNTVHFAAVYFLAGLANVAAWTLPLAMILEFGDTAKRAAYIGLGNTIVAPSFLLAPLFGGWLAEARGFDATFGAAAVAGVAAVLLLILKLRPPEDQGDD